MTAVDHRLLVLLALAFIGTARGADSVQPRPEAVSAASAPSLGETIMATAESHAREQSRGLPGKVSIVAGRLDPRTRLPACSRLEAYTPAGARPMGRTQVGVRCLSPQAWSVLVPVHVRVSGAYVSAARPLTAGQTLTGDDILTSQGELDALPAGIVTDPAGALGKTLRNSVAAGQPLRSEQLAAPLVIRQGQTVRVVSRGSGFAVSGEGQALNNAAAGQVARIRMPGGQVVHAVAAADGSAEVNF